MKKEIENSIEHIQKSLLDFKAPDDAMKLAQATLNLSHALATIDNIGK